MIRVTLLVWILLEIAAFALAGRTVGVLGTLALVVGTALVGGLLLRRQGMATLRALQGGVRGGPGGRGVDPLALLMRDGFRLVAALLLILPGLLGDVVGLLLLLPPVQRRVAADLARRGLRPMGANLGRAPRHVAPRTGAPVAPQTARDAVIDADWVEVEDPAAASGPASDTGATPRSRGGSGWTRP